MARHPLRTLTETERQLFAPHVAANRLYRTLVEGFEPRARVPGVQFDPDTYTYFIEVPDDLGAVPSADGAPAGATPAPPAPMPSSPQPGAPDAP